MEITREHLRDFLEYKAKQYELEGQIDDHKWEIETLEEKKKRLDEQNKHRLSEERLRDEAEKVLRILADNFEEFGYDNDLYFSLYFNFLLCEYERVMKICQEEKIACFKSKIGITQELEKSVKEWIEKSEAKFGKMDKKGLIQKIHG
ncbi:MAG: hypothetical protein V3W43_05250 [Desulfatiglandaceae bacterium]|jgi:hypothetical protein